MTLWPGDQPTVTRGQHCTTTFWNTWHRDAVTHLHENQAAGGGQFSGLWLGTHDDADKYATQVMLRKLDRVVLDNGVGLSNLDPLIADNTLLGIGGIDTGVVASDAWYGIYLAHNGTTGAKGLLLHREKEYFLDETYDSDDATVEIRKSTGTRTAVGQGFQTDEAGKIEFVDVEVLKVGAPTGTIWAEIRSDDGTGKPSATVLATSIKLDASFVYTSAYWIRFIFRTPFTAVAGSQYHLVMTGSWTASDAAYVGWRCDTSAAAYTRGTRTQLESATWNSTSTTAHDFSFKVYVTTHDTAVTMPSGYDGKALLGYVHHTSAAFYPFVAKDKRYVPLQSQTAIVAGGTTDTVPRLTMSIINMPPVPVKLEVFLITQTATADSTFVFPVPFGFKFPGGTWREQGGQFNGIPAGVSTQVADVVTETQAIYTYDPTAYAVVLSAWEW